MLVQNAPPYVTLVRWWSTDLDTKIQLPLVWCYPAHSPLSRISWVPFWGDYSLSIQLNDHLLDVLCIADPEHPFVMLIRSILVKHGASSKRNCLDIYKLSLEISQLQQDRTQRHQNEGIWHRIHATIDAKTCNYTRRATITPKSTSRAFVEHQPTSTSRTLTLPTPKFEANQHSTAFTHHETIPGLTIATYNDVRALDAHCVPTEAIGLAKRWQHWTLQSMGTALRENHKVDSDVNACIFAVVMTRTLHAMHEGISVAGAYSLWTIPLYHIDAMSPAFAF